MGSYAGKGNQAFPKEREYFFDHLKSRRNARMTPLYKESASNHTTGERNNEGESKLHIFPKC